MFETLAGKNGAAVSGITEHLSNLQVAKRLNSPQARWALFLGQFSFSVIYRPGTFNIKPDALCPRTLLKLFLLSQNPFYLLPVCWQLHPGKLRLWSLGLNAHNLIQETAHLTLYMCLAPPCPKCSNGDIHLS